MHTNKNLIKPSFRRGLPERRSFYFSFPRSAWECIAYRNAWFPRRAWEPETYIPFAFICVVHTDVRIPRAHDAHDCMDAGGTPPWMAVVEQCRSNCREQRRERLPRSGEVFFIGEIFRLGSLWSSECAAIIINVASITFQIVQSAPVGRTNIPDSNDNLLLTENAVVRLFLHLLQ